MQGLSRVVLVACVLAVSCFSTARGYAQEDEPHAARERFQRGVQAVQRGELARAAEEFEAAYALSPRPVVLYNLGHTYSALGRPVETVRALRAYLKSEPAPAPERVREVEELIRSNERLIGVLRLDVLPSSARLEVDAVPVTLDEGKLELAAGRHVVVAELEGHTPGVLNVDIVGATEVSARLVLTRIAPASVPPRVAGVRVGAPAPPSPEPQGTAAHRSPSTATYLAVGGVVLGAAALAVGTAFAISAEQLDDTAREQGHCDDSTCDAVGMPLRAEAHRRGNVATGLFIAGGAFVTVGVTLYFVIGP